MSAKINIEVLPATLALPDLLDAQGTLRLLSAAEYDRIPRTNLRVWCHNHARYGLPTIELVDWLKTKIAGRRTIEIGSGSGDLAFHLGIPATDSKMQEEPFIRAQYEATGQPVIRYPQWVAKFDALDAVKHYQPELVIASWVTQWIDPDLPYTVGGSIFGVREDALLDTGVSYLLIGNLDTHGDKNILALPHEQLALPFLRSRALHPELDRVFIWNDR